MVQNPVQLVDEDMSQSVKRSRSNPAVERINEEEERIHPDTGSLSTSHYHFPTGTKSGLCVHIHTSCLYT
jgi:hypothetical protein